jgi:hypothetical protein
MTQPLCSQHAIIRAQQRGITPTQIDAVVRYADMERPRGRGCISIWISRKELRRLAPSTPEGVSIDRLQGVTVVQAGDETGITAFRNRKAKAYRRRSGGWQ